MLSFLPLLVVILGLALMRWGQVRRASEASLGWRLLLPTWWANPDVRDGSRGRRFLLLGSELLAAYLLIVLMAVAATMSLGFPTGRTTLVVSGVVDGSPADGVLLPGDTILQVAGEPLTREVGAVLPPSLSSLLQSPEPTEMLVLRQGQRKTITLQPRLDGETERYFVGIALAEESEMQQTVRLGFALKIPVIAAQLVWNRMREAGKQAMQGTSSEFSGPVGIANEVRQQRSSTWVFSGIFYVGRFFWLQLLVNLVCFLLPVRRAS